MHILMFHSETDNNRNKNIMVATTKRLVQYKCVCLVLLGEKNLRVRTHNMFPMLSIFSVP